MTIFLVLEDIHVWLYTYFYNWYNNLQFMLITANGPFHEYLLTDQARILCKVTVKIQIWHVGNVVLDAFFQPFGFLLIINQDNCAFCAFFETYIYESMHIYNKSPSVIGVNSKYFLTFQKGRRTVQTANFIDSYYLSISFIEKALLGLVWSLFELFIVDHFNAKNNVIRNC